MCYVTAQRGARRFHWDRTDLKCRYGIKSRLKHKMSLLRNFREDPFCILSKFLRANFFEGFGENVHFLKSFREYVFYFCKNGNRWNNFVETEMLDACRKILEKPQICEFSPNLINVRNFSKIEKYIPFQL